MHQVENPTQVPERDLGAAPRRSVRRATARRASNRRATARSRHADVNANIIGFLAQHPASTAGDIARRLNINPGTVSALLTQLAKAGEIQKAAHGYSTRNPAPPARISVRDLAYRRRRLDQ